MTELTRKADSLAKDIISVAGGGKFVLMSKTGGDGLPIVVWRLQNGAKYDGKGTPQIPDCNSKPKRLFNTTSEFTIARRLRSRGFFVPCMSLRLDSRALWLG